MTPEVCLRRGSHSRVPPEHRILQLVVSFARWGTLLHIVILLINTDDGDERKPRFKTQDQNAIFPSRFDFCLAHRSTSTRPQGGLPYLGISFGHGWLSPPCSSLLVPRATYKVCAPLPLAFGLSLECSCLSTPIAKHGSARFDPDVEV